MNILQESFNELTPTEKVLFQVWRNAEQLGSAARDALLSDDRDEQTRLIAQIKVALLHLHALERELNNDQ